jgi:hypothetical protein
MSKCTASGLNGEPVCELQLYKDLMMLARFMGRRVSLALPLMLDMGCQQHAGPAAAAAASAAASAAAALLIEATALQHSRQTSK